MKPIKQKIDFNPLANQGWDVTDNDYVTTFGLDTRLAGTPDLNKAMLDKCEQDNVAGFMKKGLPESVARKEARKLKMKAKNTGVIKKFRLLSS